jgi:hypothetical protein
MISRLNYLTAQQRIDELIAEAERHRLVNAARHSNRRKRRLVWRRRTSANDCARAGDRTCTVRRTPIGEES